MNNTAEAWRNFAERVPLGTRVKYDLGILDDDNVFIVEGYLIENYPYAEQERIAAYPDPDSAGEAWYLHNVFPMLRHVHEFSLTDDLYPANMMYFYI